LANESRRFPRLNLTGSSPVTRLINISGSNDLVAGLLWMYRLAMRENLAMRN